MVKKHPSVREGKKSLLGQRDLEARTNELVRMVQRDLHSMTDYWDKLAFWYTRRYSDRPQVVDEPWIGASNITMPLSDIYIQQTKPFYMDLLFNRHRVVDMVPTNDEAMANVANANVEMENILRGHGVHAMPDFPVQMAYAVDSMCMYGNGIIKTFYDYRTRLDTETLRRADLPGALGLMDVFPDLSDEQARIGSMAALEVNPAAALEVVTAVGVPATVLTPSQFDGLAPKIEVLVVDAYGLDLEERRDRQALKEIMSFMRSGAAESDVIVQKKTVVQDSPRIVNVPIQNLLVPDGALLDFTRAERVTEILHMTETEARQRADAEEWQDIDTALEGASGRSGHLMSEWDSLSQAQADRNQLFWDGADDEMFRFMQSMSFERVDDTFRLVVDIFEPNSGTNLDKYVMPFDHGQMPYTALPFELNEPGFHATRGIPSLLEEIEGHTDAWFRALENNLTISTSVSSAVRRGSVENPNDIEWYPNAVLEFDDPRNDYVPIVHPQTDIPIERMIQILGIWAEREVGATPDTQLLGNARRERVTKAEIDAGQLGTQRLVGFRGMGFLQFLKPALGQAWALWKQYGPVRHTLHVTGSAPKKLTQHQTRGAFDVAPAAAVGHQDPAFRAQMAFQDLQVAREMQAALANDPRVEVDILEQYEHYLDVHDPHVRQRVVRRRSPEQVQKILGAQRQAAAQVVGLADVASKLKGLTEENAAKVLASVQEDLAKIEAQGAAAQASVARNELLTNGSVSP